MTPLDLRHYRAAPQGDEGAGVIVWLALTLAFLLGVIMGAM